MRLATLPQLDALCGEYLLGTLRGPARRRFERALADEPRVALRLATIRREFEPRHGRAFEVPIRPAAMRSGFARLRSELNLEPVASRWQARLGFWRGWALVATIALAVAIVLRLPAPDVETARVVAELADPQRATVVTAALTDDAREIELRASRPVLAGPAQSYELWLLPADGTPPISLAVLGDLTVRVPVPEAQRARIRTGASLAVSVEPAGGSPTGAPTGPVILVGQVTI